MVESDVVSRLRRATETAWRKASFCAAGECVEVAQQDRGVALRNSTDPCVVLRCTIEEWRSFVRGVKAGEFDYLGRASSFPGGRLLQTSSCGEYASSIVGEGVADGKRRAFPLSTGWPKIANALALPVDCR